MVIHDVLPQGFMFQFYMLLIRGWKDVWRRRSAAFSQIFRSILMAILVGTIFTNLQLNQADVQSRFGVFYFCLSYFGFSAMLELPYFFESRRAFYAQKSAGFFRHSTYFLSSSLCNVPVFLTEVCFVFAIVIQDQNADLDHLSRPFAFASYFTGWWVYKKVYGVLSFCISSFVPFKYVSLVDLSPLYLST